MKKLLQLIIVFIIISNSCFAQSIATQYTLGKKRVGDSVGYYATGNGKYIDKITTAGCWWNLWDFTRNIYDTINLRFLKKSDSSIYTSRFKFDSTIGSLIIGGGAVNSVFGRVGTIVAANGDYNSDLVTEGTTNLYFTNDRFDARLWVDTPTILWYIKYLDGLKFKITDTSGKWQYAMGFLPYTKSEVNTIANLRLLISDSNTYTGYISKAFYYANLPSSTTYTNGANIGLSGNAFYLDTSANHAATKTDLLSYVRNADTANMLSGYQRKGDSIRYSTVYRNDTGNANIRTQIAALPTTDSAVFQTVYRSDTGRKNIYAYASTKVKYTDTAAMLTPYLRKIDTTAMLTPYLRKVDTTAMLAPYMRENDSTKYFTKYRSDTMRSDIYTYIGTKGTGSVTSITASAPLTGGVITTSGSIGLDQSANYTWSGTHTFTNTNGLLIYQNGVSGLSGLTGVLADAEGSSNSFLAMNVRNQSNGANASGDITVTADNGTNTTHFVDMGVNSSGFSQGTWTINGTNDGYLYMQDDNLAVGTATAGKDLVLFSGGTLAANERMRIAGTGLVSLSNQISYAGAMTIASSATVNLCSATSNMVTISGTTTITSLGNCTTTNLIYVKFSGALTLTYNATSLLLPSAANITTVANDQAVFQNLGSGNWKCIEYVPYTVTGTGSQVRAAGATFTGTTTTAALSPSGTITHSGTTLTSTCTTCTVGSAATATTVNLGTGATTTGVTKAVNIGTAGLAGSTTTTIIGTSAIGALGNTTINQPVLMGVGTYTVVGTSINAVQITPTYNQASGNAANTDLLINRTQTSVGSGAQNLIDAQVGATSKFKVSNTGVVTVAAVGTATGSMATVDGTQTLTNKRWTARVGSTTSSGTPTINTDNVDIYKLTAQAANITSMTSSLSGTPVDGDILGIQVTGTGSFSWTWGASFVDGSTALPTTITTTTKTVILQYYTTSSYGNNKWVCSSSY